MHYALLMTAFVPLYVLTDDCQWMRYSLAANRSPVNEISAGRSLSLNLLLLELELLMMMVIGADCLLH